MGLLRSSLPNKIKKVVELTYVRREDLYVKRPKYSNRSQVCWSKHQHQSVLEADYCNELLILKKSGEVKSYTIQHKIEIYVKGKHITNHYVDFLVKFPGGRLEFHETKGYDQDVWKLKKRLVEALFPKIPYVVKRERTSFYSRKTGVL